MTAEWENAQKFSKIGNFDEFRKSIENFRDHARALGESISVEPECRITKLRNMASETAAERKELSKLILPRVKR